MACSFGDFHFSLKVEIMISTQVLQISLERGETADVRVR